MVVYGDLCDLWIIFYFKLVFSLTYILHLHSEKTYYGDYFSIS